MKGELEEKLEDIRQIEEEIDQYADNLQDREQRISELLSENTKLKTELSSAKLLQKRVMELESQVRQQSKVAIPSLQLVSEPALGIEVPSQASSVNHQSLD